MVTLTAKFFFFFASGRSEYPLNSEISVVMEVFTRENSDFILEDKLNLMLT